MNSRYILLHDLPLEDDKIINIQQSEAISICLRKGYKLPCSIYHQYCKMNSLFFSPVIAVSYGFLYYSIESFLDKGTLLGNLFNAHSLSVL